MDTTVHQKQHKYSYDGKKMHHTAVENEFIQSETCTLTLSGQSKESRPILLWQAALGQTSLLYSASSCGAVVDITNKFSLTNIPAVHPEFDKQIGRSL